MSSEQRWGNMTSYARIRRPVLAAQAVLLLAGFVVFDLVPGQVVPRAIPDDVHRLYWAVLLAVKNPTVIAFYLIWMVGIVRHMMLPPGRHPGTAVPGAPPGLRSGEASGREP